MGMERSPKRTGKRDGFTLGRDRFDKISEVEGMSLTAAMKRDFRDLDRQKLSAVTRKERVLAKYGKPRP